MEGIKNYTINVHSDLTQTVFFESNEYLKGDFGKKMRRENGERIFEVIFHKTMRLSLGDSLIVLWEGQENFKV